MKQLLLIFTFTIALSFSANAQFTSDSTSGGIQQKDQVISMSPNPATNYVVIKNEEGIDKIEIYNVLGEKISQNLANTNKEISLNISDLKSGIYLVNITDIRGTNTIKKLIKN